MSEQHSSTVLSETAAPVVTQVPENDRENDKAKLLAELEHHEEVIGAGLKNFAAVGESLREIRDMRLYADSHPAFDEYCRSRWRLSVSQVNRYIEAARVATELTPIGVTLFRESHARRLSAFKDGEKIRTVYQRAQEIAGGKPVAAKHISRAFIALAFPDECQDVNAPIIVPPDGTEKVERAANKLKSILRMATEIGDASLIETISIAIKRLEQVIIPEIQARSRKSKEDYCAKIRAARRKWKQEQKLKNPVEPHLPAPSAEAESSLGDGGSIPIRTEGFDLNINFNN